ncbi:MAG: hypothetical protein N3A69_08505 [Leptospiraceae bacterium]|nr:hypothetical protein [Leptospiraceae bacterium]
MAKKKCKTKLLSSRNFANILRLEMYRLMLSSVISSKSAVPAEIFNQGLWLQVFRLSSSNPNSYPYTLLGYKPLGRKAACQQP